MLQITSSRKIRNQLLIPDFFMSIQEDLHTVLDIAEQPLTRLDVITEHLPTDWIQAAATLSAEASIRRRRLPPDMVL